MKNMILTSRLEQ